jgi:ferric-dicitrate binding protein FerR (iron transport regulator)
VWARSDGDVRASENARLQAWRAANPEKARAQRRKQRYALDASSFARILATQSNQCAICRSPEPRCVDHCHVTKRVRGILCRSCNIALGQFRDDPRIVLAAAAYVEGARRSP